MTPAARLADLPPDADTTRCLRLLGGITSDPALVRLLVVDGEPRSKARPRFGGNGRVYSSHKQVEAEAALGWHLRRAFREPLAGNLALACIFYRSTHGRVDVDNMLKLVMDAANTICWRDDYQVTAILGVVELDRARPRTVIAVAPHASSLSRADVEPQACATCAKVYTPRNGSRPGRFCSRRCASLSRGQDLRAAVTCVVCSTPFVRENASQVYCGDACRLTGLHARLGPKRVRACAGCGVTLANPKSKRCRDCWRAAPKVGA